jgi:hypothetical protein
MKSVIGILDKDNKQVSDTSYLYEWSDCFSLDGQLRSITTNGEGLPRTLARNRT